MAELGALPDVVEKCLNHTEVAKVKRIYQRAQYEGPMREAWKLLGTRLALLQGMALHGRWQMADGRWQMADGRWQMADGSITNGVPMQRAP